MTHSGKPKRTKSAHQQPLRESEQPHEPSPPKRALRKNASSTSQARRIAETADSQTSTGHAVVGGSSEAVGSVAPAVRQRADDAAERLQSPSSLRHSSHRSDFDRPNHGGPQAEPGARGVGAADPDEAKADSIKLDQDSRRVMRWKTRLRSVIGFLASLSVHGIILILLALISLAVPQVEIWEVDAALPPPVPVEDDLELSVSAESAAGGATLAGGMLETKAVEFEVSALDSIDRLVAGSRLAELNKPGGLLSDQVGSAGLGERVALRQRGGDGSDHQSTFFGTQVGGQAIVYVVDSSNSMRGARLERAVAELKRSVESLSEDQFFYVVFFDGNAHPMFGEPARESRLRAVTPVHLGEFQDWVSRATCGNFTRPLEATRIALSLRPDAIFLLSDGEFQDNTVGFLQSANPDPDAMRRGEQAIPFIRSASRVTSAKRRYVGSQGKAGEASALCRSSSSAIAFIVSFRIASFSCHLLRCFKSAPFPH